MKKNTKKNQMTVKSNIKAGMSMDALFQSASRPTPQVVGGASR